MEESLLKKIHVKKSTVRKFRRAGKQIKRSARFAAQSAGRGLYLGFRSLSRTLMRLPVKTIWIGVGAISTALVLVIVLALALPGRAPATANADAAEPWSISAMADPAADAPNIMETAGGENGGNDALPAADVPDTQTLDTPEVQTRSEGEPTVADAAVTDGAIDMTAFKELSEGDDDPLVSEIQARLMELGYMDSDEPTEHYGPLTKKSVKAFQAHNGLNSDGVCGLTTYTLLVSDNAKVYVMQSGDEGENVESVQQRLYELGYITSKSNVTGTFGEKTDEAVKEFQKANKLTNDGKVGDKTIETLFSEDAVGKCFRIGDKDDTIKSVQKRLKKLGYYKGDATGEYTKTTASAVKKFQAINGLVVDGQLGPSTKDAILSNDAQAYVMQLGDSGSDVEKVQKQLAKLNYMRSANATGYFGEKTEDAVKAFQTRNKLHSDGKVGSGTYSALFSSSAKKAKSTSTGGSSSGSGSSGSGSSGSSGNSGSGSSGSSGNSGSSDSKGIEKMIDIAESKLGCSYVGGAKGPNNFDCSGFVYYCLRQSGVSVSYMTSIGWRTTSKFKRISSLKDCKRGDILVFSGTTMAKGHVGIYLGSGKMIDAGSSEGCVRITKTVLSGKYWPSHFLMAYRVF